MTEESINAFHVIRRVVAAAPTLQSIDWKRKFCLNVDASTYGHGSVLWQPRFLGDKVCAENIVSIRSHSSKDYERGYRHIPYKIELLSLVTALKDYHYILAGRRFTVYTDHEGLTSLHSQKAMDNRHIAGWRGEMLAYNFDVVHVMGVDNQLADHLSRLYPANWGVLLEVSTDTTASPSQTCQSMSQERSETILKDILASLRTVSPSEDEVISEAKRNAILRAHGPGHWNSRYVLQELRKSPLASGWKSMRRDVYKVLGKCKPCWLWNRNRHFFNPIRSITANLPFDHIQLDYIQHLTETSDGYRYGLVCVDMFSRFTILLPLKTLSGVETIDALWGIFSLFGVPKIIHTDNAKAFETDVMMQHFLTKLKALHIPCAPYSHRSIGAVEKMVGVSSTDIHKLMAEHGGNWKDNIHTANLAINMMVKDLTGFCPYSLLFGRPCSILEDFVPRPIPVNGVPDSELQAWIDFQSRVLNELFPSVRDRIAANQFRQRVYFDKAHLVNNTIIPKGTLVMLWDDRRVSKEDPPYLGPYSIVAKTASGHYLLKDSVGALLDKEVPADKLKILSHTSVDEAPNDDWYADRIIDDRIDPHTKERMYRVRWTGYAEDDDTWEPAVNVTEILQAYLASKRRLPKEQRSDNSRPFTSPSSVLGKRHR